MAKSTGKKSKIKKTEKKIIPYIPTVIHFADYVNYGEVAAILTEKVNKLCKSSKELSHVAMEDGFNYETFRDVLEELIDSTMLDDLMQSELGQGILVGLYLMRSAELNGIQEETTSDVVDEDYG